jgi:hypothetical protein
MATETANASKSNAVRIKGDKKERAARVARKEAANRDQYVSAASVVDEILDEGLSKRERKLGLV